MKAIEYTEYGPPEVLHLTERETPTPGDGDILVRIHATTATAADSHMRQADPFIARFFTGLIKPKRTVPGMEFAGVVDTIGKGVTRFAVGDQIWGATGENFGSHAEYAILQEDDALSLKPGNLTFEESAAICEGGLTALPFLRDEGKVHSGQKVLINGASGSVGTSAVQIAKHFGAEVTAVCSTSNLELVASLGADKVIDYTHQDFTETGETYDVIFDAVGKTSFSRCKHSLRSGGVYLTTVISFAIFVHMLWTALAGSKKARFAATGLRPSSERTKDLAMLKEIVEAGELKPVIDRVYPLEQTADAHRYVDQGHKKGNVVIQIVPS